MEWVGMGVAGSIFAQENIKGLMRKIYIYPTRWKKNVVLIIHIYGVKAIFSYFMITKILNLSHKK